jgi:DNA-binding NarL/FixJ family response regulator
MKVFLVEDAPLLRERLETLITSIPGSRTVGHATSAREAVSAIEAARPDVVVLDVHLAEGSGFDVLRSLRATGNTTDIYVLTNYPQDAYRHTAEKLGARGFFDKTTEFEALRAALAARKNASSPTS